MRRGGPLARRTPLRAHTALARTRIRRCTVALRSRYTGPPRALRDAVKERDGGRCLCCGAVGDLVVNHRRSGHGHPQSGPQWLTTSCSGCNGDYEDRPLLAYAGGWKLPAGADPLAQPVRDHLGFWWLLDALGGRALVVAE